MTSPNIFKPQNIDIVLAKVNVDNKKALIEVISDQISKHSTISGAAIFTRLTQKEKDQSSGIGENVAIPHARILQLHKPITMLVTLQNKIDFNAPDNRYVDIIYTLLSPRTDGALHLQRLSAVSRMLKNKDMLEKLREADDEYALHNILQSPQGWMLAA